MLDWKPPKDTNYLAGVDEVGRGALAGDVVVGAVILPIDHGIKNLRDSKRLSQSHREALFETILKCSVSYSIGRSSAQEIDESNILKATLTAMVRAVDGLAITPDYVAVDGINVPDWNYRGEAIIRGDSKIDAIQAASIIAKVIRDCEMSKLDFLYPGYNFSSNKGYGTREHLSALSNLGPAPIHRVSFSPINNKD